MEYGLLSPNIQGKVRPYRHKDGILLEDLEMEALSYKYEKAFERANDWFRNDDLSRVCASQDLKLCFKTDGHKFSDDSDKMWYQLLRDFGRCEER